MRPASLSTLSVAFTLSLMALSADAGLVRIYITNSAGDSIHVIDPATNKVVQEIKGIEAAHGIGFATDGSKVYVSNEADSTLDVFDRESGKLIKQIKLSDHPNNIAVTKNGDRVVVAIAREPGALDIIDNRHADPQEDDSGQWAPAQRLCDARRPICGDGIDPEEAHHGGRPRDRADRMGARPRGPADDDRSQ